MSTNHETPEPLTLSYFKNIIDPHDVSILTTEILARDMWRDARCRLMCTYTSDNTPVCISKLALYLQTLFPVILHDCIVVNLFKNGRDSYQFESKYNINYEHDTLTVVLGHTRELVFKNTHTDNVDIKYSIESGDVYYTNAKMHNMYRYSIPPRENVHDNTMTITFFIV